MSDSGENLDPKGKQPAELDSDSSKGDSRGGFETLLGQMVVDHGMVTEQELLDCKQLLEKASESDRPRTLSEILFKEDYVTQRQLERLKRDFADERVSRRIPGYRIIRKLGEGAMAKVFLAKQISLDRLVAIKILPIKFSSNETFIERFYKEGRAAAKLNDQNIVGAYDVGKAGEHHYFVMEYVDGDTVYDRIKKARKLEESEAIDIVLQVASALKHAHSQGFIHRDIKPKNIMISSTGTVKLADLGLARAITDKEAAEAESGRAYGTPFYISPEQIRGQVDIGKQCDIYGLGATFYHMVTGRVPFEGKNPSEVMHRHLKSELKPPDHVNPDLGAGVSLIIEKMMAKKVPDRYQEVETLIEDLDAVVAGNMPIHARPVVDMQSVLSTIESQNQEPEIVRPAHEPGLMSNPLVIALLIGCILSVLLNVVLILISM